MLSYAEVNKIFSRFDYAGINILISGSAFPPIYYGMYCNLNLAVFYLSLIAVIATAVFITSLFEWIHTEGNKIYKALLFGGFGVFLIVPVSHMLINEYLGNWGD
jgi:adiponectin receptor